MSEFIANIKARLNTSEIPKDIKKIEGQPVKLNNVTIEPTAISSMVKQIQAGLNNAKFSLPNLSPQMQQQGANSGKQFANAFTSQLNTIAIKNNGIIGITKALQDFGYDTKSISSITKKLQDLDVATGQLQIRARGNGLMDVRIKGVDELGRSVDETRRFVNGIEDAERRVTSTVQKFGASASQLKTMGKIEFGIETNSFKAEIDSIVQDAHKLTTVSQDIDYNRYELQKAFNTMTNKGEGIDVRIEAYERFNQLLPIVKAQLIDAANAEQTLTQSSTKILQIKEWMEKNSAATEVFGNELNSILAKLNGNSDSKVLKDVDTQFRNIQVQAEALKTSVSSVSQVNAALSNNSVAKSISDTEQKFRSLQSTINSLNSSSIGQGIKTNVTGIESQFKEIARLSAELSGGKLSDSAMVTKYNELQSVLAAVRNNISITANDVSKLADKERDAAAAAETLSKSTTLLSQVQSWSDNNAVAAEHFRRELDEITNKLHGNSDPALLKNLSLQFNEIKAKAKELELDTISLKRVMSDLDGGATGVSKLSKDISDVETKFRSLRETINNLKSVNPQLYATQELSDVAKGLDRVRQLERELGSGTLTPAEMSKKYVELRDTLSSVDRQISIVKTDVNGLSQAERDQAKAAEEVAKANQTLTRSETLSNKIEAWMNANTEAAKRYGTQLQAIQQQLKNNQDPEVLKRMTLEFSKIQSEAKAAGLVVNNFASSLKNTALQVLGLTSAVAIFHRGVRVLKEMVQNVKDVDKAMTELYRVTNLSSSQYEALYDKMANSAKKYGATLSDIINSTASWVRLGFNADMAAQLSEISAMYQHVTDLDEGTAVKNLVTAYKGFQDSLLSQTDGNEVEAFKTISDVYDRLGNEFAESAADVGNGLARAASVLQQGGADIQQAAGMFTGIQEVLQNDQTSGNALKILTLRIRGMKGELEELGEEVDENITSVSKIQTQILNLTHGKVNIFENDGKSFRNIYNIMQDISNIWDDLEEKSQAELLEIIAGKHRANAVQALINQWDRVEEATEAAYNSAGTAAKEQAIYMESIEGKLNSLEASWQALSNSVINSSLIKGGVSVLTALTNGADKFVKAFGSLPTILIAASAALSGFKNIGIFKTMQDKSSLSGLRIGNIFGNISEYINKLRETTNGISLGDTFNNSISKDTIALNNFTKKFAECKSAETAFEATMKGASVSAQAFALKMHETGASVDDFVKSQKMQEVALISQNKSLTNVRGLLDEYNLGCKNVGLTQQDFVQSVGQSNRVLGNYLSSVGDGEATMGGYVKSMISAKLATVGLQAATIALNTAISMGVALAIQTIITLCDKLIVTEKEVAEAAEKAMSQYKEAQETLKSNKATIDEISSDYEKLSKGVDKFGNNISLSTSEYERYHEITSKIKNMFPEMISGYDSEGNAIVKTKGDVEALTKAYEEQAQVARQSLLYEGNKIFENYKNNTEGGFFDGWTLFTISDAKIDQQIRAIEKILDESKSEADLFNDFDMTALTSVFEGAGIDWSWWDNTPFGKSSIKRARENQDVLRQYLNTLKGLRETEVAPAKTVIDAYLESTENKKYQSLSQNSKDAVKSIVQQLDHEFYDQFKTMPDAENAVMQRIVEPISKNNSLTNAFDYMSNAQEKLAQGKITMGEYQEEITRFVKSIGELDGETQKYAKMSFGLELDKNNVSKDIQNVINQLKSLGIDKQFGDGASELFVNKLSLPEFSQMLNNGGQFKDSITKWLQENQGATAAQFSDWFNSVLSESANSVSDSSSVILNAFDKAATGITEFKNAMDSSKGSIKSGTEAFEGYADAYTNAMKLINEGYDLDNGKLYAYMELLLGKDTLEKYGYNVDTLKGKLKELKGVYGDKNSLGDGFLDKLKKSVDKNGDLKLGKETIATFDKKSGEWSVDNNHFADVAKALGMTEDGLVACIQAMSTWSDVALESLTEIKARAESAGAVYHEQFDKELKGKDIVNLNTLRDNMKSNGYTDKQTYDAIEQLKSDKNVITIDVKADSSAKDIIGQLSKVNLVGKDSDGKSVLDLSGTVEMLKSTGSLITDITDIITTLNDSDSIQVKVDGKSIEDLGVLRTKIEELYNTTSTQAQHANDVLKELGLTNFNFVFDSNSKKEVENGLINIRTILESLKKDGKLDLSVDGATEAQLIFSQLMHEQQELNAPTVMKVDTSQLSESQESIKTAIQKIQEFKRICNEIEINQELGIDTTEAEKKANSLANQIKGIDSNILTTLSLDTSSVDSLKASINNVTGEQLVKVGIDQKAIIGWKPDDKNAKVKFIVDSTDVDKYKKQSDDKTAIVHFSKDSTEVDRYDPKDLKRTVTYRVRTEGSVEANGTAHLSGTAKAGGDWGTAKGGTALVGELGEEVIVDPHTGRWYTVGENGAEFRDIPQGAIVFNHKQTESLLKYGHINSRGTSLVGGTALMSGTAYASGVTSSRSSATSTTKKKKKTTTKSTKKSSSKSSSKKSSKSSSKTNNDDYTDWIEIAISRVERVITNLETKAKNSYQALSERLKATSDEIPQINKEINVQQKGADRYLRQANSVKLSSDLKKKVREGTIDIKKYDESTQKLITSYKKWYDKSLACSDAVTKLKQSLAALYKERFETVQKDYNNQLSVMESKANILNEKVSALEASGYLKSSNVYFSLKSNKLQEVKKMEEEKSSLEKMLAEGVKSGTIVKYSEAWYSMSQQIDSTALSIAKAKTELIGYDNTIRKIDWEHFDYLQDRISQIPTEAKFLSELLDEEKLYEDNGAFTKYGTAKLGLNVQDYNVYTNQAKQYAQEISAVNKLLAEDPFNTNLISRREELLKLQRESIKSANEEKKAVKSLVEEGIKKELSSVKELIDSYTSQLDCTKDLYDYQKKISDKTSNIASLNKQLTAYSNDLSEESKSKVQKLKVEIDKAQTELQETQYERSISEQKKLLDNFYSDYEETLNKRLDDVDGLLSNMTDVVNANGSGINQTLKEISSAVGYGITAITESIWNNSSSIDKSVNSAIGSTKSNVANMVANSNAYVKKYATGGLVDYTGIAKVDGSKSKPELVLNPQDTQNLLAVVSKIKDIPITVAGQEFAGYKSMVQHAIASPDLYGKMSTIQNHTVNQEVSNNVTLNVNIDHVENYEDFVDKLKRDSQFEKMVQSMTVDRMVGGSALSKHKYSWK